MDYWIKYYIDGKRIYGNRFDKQHQLVSWSKTPLDNINRVELIVDNQKIGIYGTGEFWQYDTYEANSSTGKSVLISKSIQRLVWPCDLIIGFSKDNYVSFLKYEDIKNLHKFTPIIHILPKEYGSWFTWTYNKLTKSLSYSFRKKRG